MINIGVQFLEDEDYTDNIRIERKIFKFSESYIILWLPIMGGRKRKKKEEKI